jgi:non-ribosomal peptide synthase protein (TIGR01720 family)
VLLTALAGAYEKVTGHKRIKIDMEGHGREEVMEGVDVSRTVGWFTTIYPVALDQGDSSDIGERVKAIKEKVREIPNRGIGYGVLNYLAKTDGIGEKSSDRSSPEIRFNYLGQTDQGLRNSSLFGIARESTGLAQSPLARRPSLLEVNCWVSEGRFRADYSYYKDVHRRASVQRLAEAFVKELRAIINHTLIAGAANYSPSDFPLAGISQQQLDKVITKLKRSR